MRSRSACRRGDGRSVSTPRPSTAEPLSHPRTPAPPPPAQTATRRTPSWTAGCRPRVPQAVCARRGEPREHSALADSRETREDAAAANARALTHRPMVVRAIPAGRAWLPQ
ncbi:hypothetical protein ACFPRL_35710 [Pseudoclavibacter helvolus]